MVEKVFSYFLYKKSFRGFEVPIIYSVSVKYSTEVYLYSTGIDCLHK